MNKLTSLDKLEIFLLLVLSVEYPFEFFIAQGILPSALYFIFVMAILLIPALRLFSFQKRRIKINEYELAIICVFIILFFASILMIAIKKQDILKSLLKTVPFLYLFDAICLKNKSEHFWESFFRILAIISIGVFIYFLLSFNLDINLALKRRYTWNEQFYYSGLFYAAPAYFIFSIVRKKDIILSSLYLFSGLIISLVSLKRYFLIDLLFLLITAIFLFFIDFKKYKKFFLAFILFSIVLLIFVTSNNSLSILLQTTISRIDSSADNIVSFDRFVESSEYFKDLNYLDIFVGRTFCGSHSYLGNTNYSLHIGWTNFFYKGGLPLFILFAIPFVEVVRKKTLLSNDNIIRYSSAYLLFMFFRFFYSNIDGLYPNMLLFFTCILTIVRAPKTVLNTKKSIECSI